MSEWVDLFSAEGEGKRLSNFWNTKRRRFFKSLHSSTFNRILRFVAFVSDYSILLICLPVNGDWSYKYHFRNLLHKTLRNLHFWVYNQIKKYSWYANDCYGFHQVAQFYECSINLLDICFKKSRILAQLQFSAKVNWYSYMATHIALWEISLPWASHKKHSNNLKNYSKPVFNGHPLNINWLRMP